MSLIEGKVNFYQGANETPESSAEKTQETYEGLKSLEASIKANVYTDEKANNQNSKDKYRLKASSINFLEIQGKTLTTKEYGNSEFDHMLKNALIIQWNKNKAWEKYNEITEWNYTTDSIWNIFNNLIKFMKSKWLDRPIDRTWAYTNADFLYMVGLGQALVIREKKEDRKDYSANKVSTNFGDYILGFNSMNDFESMDFWASIDLIKKENELKQLKNDITIQNTSTADQPETAEEEQIDKALPEETTEEFEILKNDIQEAKEEKSLGSWQFPKENNIYTQGTDIDFFTMQDVEKRWIKNIGYLPIMYASLNISWDLSDIENKDELKEFVGLLLQQADKVISQLKAWILIQSGYPIEDAKYDSGYVFEKTKEETGDYQVKISFTKEWIMKIFDPIAQEWEFGKFSKSIKINGKEEQIIINTRTPEMIKAYNTSVIQGRGIGDRKWKLKEKFIFEPQGVSIEKIDTQKKEDIQITKIRTNEREIYNNGSTKSVT